MKSLHVFFPAIGCWLVGLGVAVGHASRCAGDELKLRTIHSQPSFVFGNDQVEVAVTEIGGHAAPVTFYRRTDKPVQPYYISPWQDENHAQMPAPVLVPLRGDFFCLPFGGNTDAAGGEKHPPHGEIVGNKWTSAGVKKSGKVTTFTLAVETKVRPGRVTKELSLVDGQNVVYSRHTIEGFAGPAPLGHHATLAMPDQEGTVRIATSAFRFGMTCPSLFGNPRDGEYQSLLPGAKWTDMRNVPVWAKGLPEADLTRLPARYGYADLIQIINEPWENTESPAWTTATNTDAGYVWFSLKDPGVLRTTVFWIENHGRHGHPWNGRNNCLGLEDVTSHFADGLAASIRENTLTREGVKTAVELKGGEPFVVNYIQGVVRIPAGFDVVEKLEFSPGKVTFISVGGPRVTAPVKHEFLKSGKL
jgi:hypothetical protein